MILLFSHFNGVQKYNLHYFFYKLCKSSVSYIQIYTRKTTI
jgi:hypothetical protein